MSSVIPETAEKYLKEVLAVLQTVDQPVAKWTPTGLWYEFPSPPVVKEGLPILFLHPAPYHPLEVFLALQDKIPKWTGEVVREDFEKVAILRQTPGWAKFEKYAEVLGWDAKVVAVLWHLFTPFFTEGASDLCTLVEIQTLRILAVNTLLPGEYAGVDPDRSRFIHMCDFWERLGEE